MTVDFDLDKLDITPTASKAIYQKSKYYVLKKFG